VIHSFMFQYGASLATSKNVAAAHTMDQATGLYEGDGLIHGKQRQEQGVCLITERCTHPCRGQTIVLLDHYMSFSASMAGTSVSFF